MRFTDWFISDFQLNKMPMTLKKSSQTISVKWSASHMTNNLTINRASESRRATTYGLSHKSGFTMVKTPLQTSDLNRDLCTYSR